MHFFRHRPISNCIYKFLISITVAMYKFSSDKNSAFAVPHFKLIHQVQIQYYLHKSFFLYSSNSFFFLFLYRPIFSVLFCRESTFLSKAIVFSFTENLLFFHYFSQDCCTIFITTWFIIFFLFICDSFYFHDDMYTFFFQGKNKVK